MREEDQQAVARLTKAGPGLAPALAGIVDALDSGEMDAARERAASLSIADAPALSRRLRLSIDIAIDAIDALRRKGAAERIGFGTEFGQAPSMQGLGLTGEDLQAIAKALVGAARQTGARRWPCPACGGSGAQIGKAPMIGRGQPYGRMYFDQDALLAPWTDRIEATPLQWDLVVAHIINRLNLTAPVARCDGCSLFYLDWEFVQERINAFYETREAVDFQIDGEAISGRAHAPVFVFSKLALPLYLEALLGGLSGKRFFDLGCAEGLMVEATRRLGADASGADVDRSKIHYARSVFGLPVSDDPGALEALEDGSVDVLCSYHTVEHLVQAGPWIDTMRDKVVPGGHLVISVPCVSVAPNGEVIEMGGDHWIGFDGASLRAHMDARGLEVVDLKSDDGIAPLTEPDPIIGCPLWSGRRVDTTVVARRAA